MATENNERKDLKKLNILWKGPVFNPTGIATAAREMIKGLVMNGHNVRTLDVWTDKYDFSKDLAFLNKPMNAEEIDATVVYNYPEDWIDAYKNYGKKLYHFVHEGTKIFPHWAQIMNEVLMKNDGIFFVCSKANQNLFKWNNVLKLGNVINHGYNPEIYKKRDDLKEKDSFIFLSVNSWTGSQGDRKGTDLLIKAFDEEFKDGEATLVLKISTFWATNGKEFYEKKIEELLGHKNENIIINCDYVEEEKLALFYNKANVFVAPTRGEGFGLTILNSLASACPVIVTNDDGSGHMDICRGNEGVIFIDSNELKDADRRFYVEGNKLAEPDFEDLKRKMRFAFDNKDKLELMGIKGSDFVKDLTWENQAKKLANLIYD